jgi:hypothetical protein
MAIEIAGGTRIDESADDGSSTIRPNAAGAVDAVDARGSLSWVRQGESDQGGECGGLDHRAKSILGPLNTRGRFLWSGRAAAVVAALVPVIG